MYLRKGIINFGNPGAICGCNYVVQLHHVRSLKDMKRSKDHFAKLIVSLRIKLIPLCRKYHLHFRQDGRWVNSASFKLKDTKNIGLSEDLEHS
jgi:hypothetical protein